MNRERGAIVVYVAIALVVLLAFSSLVIDYGILWTARAQAQNVADGAAHAGAVALAFDSFDDRSAGGAAKQAALAMAASAKIWGQPPRVTPADIDFPNVPGDADCASGSNPPCVRVNVFRTAARGNPLPTVFGHFVGIASQDIQATATAKAEAANASTCVKPWIVVDRWQDNRPPATTFDRYDNKEQLLPDPVDVYIPPSLTSPGTGYTLADVGTLVMLKIGTPGDAVAPSFFFAVELPGGSDYRGSISSCTGVPVAIGQTLESKPGNMVGPTRQGVADLLARDPNATWNTATNRVEHSCAQSANPCATISPRLVAVSLFNPDTYSQGHQTGRFPVPLVNIMGFFVVGFDASGNVTGYIAQAPGDMTGTGVGQTSSFLRTVRIVR